MRLQYLVKECDNGKTIKDILKKKLYISNILMNKLKMTNSILVDNVPRFTSYILHEKNNIIIDFDNMDNVIYNDSSNMYYEKYKYLDKYKRYNFKLDILYEDEYLLIVNKPAYMAVHPSCANYDDTLSNAVATYLESQNIYSIHIINRLDKNTSGICIFAKNEYIQELFIRKKADIKFKKEYIAIVNNIVKEDHKIIEKNISRASNSIILREVNENGNYAKTEFWVERRDFEKNYTCLKVLLHTGRTHQIRVHMSSISHTLLGDTLYGEVNRDENIDRYIKRQALHAYHISFFHPLTNDFIDIISSLPKDMLNLYHFYKKVN